MLDVRLLGLLSLRCIAKIDDDCPNGGVIEQVLRNNLHCTPRAIGMRHACLLVDDGAVGLNKFGERTRDVRHIVGVYVLEGVSAQALVRLASHHSFSRRALVAYRPVSV